VPLFPKSSSRKRGAKTPLCLEDNIVYGPNAIIVNNYIDYMYVVGWAAGRASGL